MIFKKIKKFLFATTFIFSLLGIANSPAILAQGLDAQRTSQTRIADLLNRFPAEQPAEFDRAMKEMASFGAKDLASMALLLTKTGNNEKVEYALSGLAFYASQQKDDDLTGRIVEGYGQALDQLDFREGKAFLIENLRVVGKDEAVHYLEPYLADEALVSPAARALASIATENAAQVLINALRNAGSDEARISLVTALGDSESLAAASLIEPFVNAQQQALRKVAIHSLAKIGAESSADYLVDAAEAADYKYEETHAASELLNYVQNLARRGDTKTALSIAKRIHKNARNEGQFHSKAGALQLRVRLDPERSTKLLQKAGRDANPVYRNVALDLAAEGNLEENLDSWVKRISKADDAVKVDFIRTLGKLEGANVLEIIRPHFTSSNPELKQQAIASAVLVGEDQVLPDFLKMINTADEEELQAIKSALLTMEGKNISNEVAKVLPAAPEEAKVALIQVLAARPSSALMPVVLEEINSSNIAVKEAALTALGSMAAPAHLQDLLGLLKGHDNPNDLTKIQEAIIAAVSQIDSKSKQTTLALQALKELSPEKQVYLYDVLARTGGSTALTNLHRIFQQGNANQKKVALNAIASWADDEAMDVLFSIAEKESNKAYAEAALQGYINLVGKSAQTAVGKVLFLRKALDQAGSDATIALALKALAKYPTLQALMVSGSYLDDPAVQQEAARAVMEIALANTELYGDEVRKLIQKTMQVISGQDSQYFKASLQKHLDEMPEGKGFYPLFNGENLEGWKGLVANPIKRQAMSPAELAREQEKANEVMRQGWEVRDGLLVFTGKGQNLVTEKKYGDFEMTVDWKITEMGDAGIYLRGTPQVQIWDIANEKVGAQVGSGGLYNNQKHPSKPLTVADNPVGEWNTFHITMKGDQVTVYLNGILVVDEVVLENYWDRSMPIFPEEQIELQAHGSYVAYRDIYIRELPRTEIFQLSEEEKREGFEVLFDGSNLDKWTGNKTDYVVENGEIVIYPDRGGKGNLFTQEEFSDFIFRFEFKLTPGANNGLGIRAPLTGDAAYAGMELQILDNTAEIYKNLEEYQFHGSLYGIAAAKKGHLKPVGEWNYQEVRVEGDRIQVILNGSTILDTDISGPRKNGTLDKREHPGLNRKSGHIGFLGHGDIVYFRNIRVKDLSKE